MVNNKCAYFASMKPFPTRLYLTFILDVYIGRKLIAYCCACAVHLQFILDANAVHLQFILDSSAVHLQFISDASALHLQFILDASAVHL